MSDSTLKGLRDFMTQRYDDLKRRLTLQLGSADMAGEALQETWVRLESSKDSVDTVQYPLSYVMRMATNAALDRIRAERRFLGSDEVEQVFEALADAAPGPAQVVEARSEMQKLSAVIEEMPARRRRILILIRVDDMPRQEVADRLGISLSLVDRELKCAHEYVVERMR
ncbi:MAG TPA: RNA polymerase sigma factor [Herbaspirillum sp.]|jgi:RNA polymerase sigma-70 factor (ECF subfamily)